MNAAENALTSPSENLNDSVENILVYKDPDHTLNLFFGCLRIRNQKLSNGDFLLNQYEEFLHEVLPQGSPLARGKCLLMRMSFQKLNCYLKMQKSLLNSQRAEGVLRFAPVHFFDSLHETQFPEKILDLEIELNKANMFELAKLGMKNPAQDLFFICRKLYFKRILAQRAPALLLTAGLIVTFLIATWLLFFKAQQNPLLVLNQWREFIVSLWSDTHSLN